MIRRLFLAAIAAGVLAGVIISAIHQVTTVPIILQAETYEDAATKASVNNPGRVLSAGFRFLNPAFISRPPPVSLPLLWPRLLVCRPKFLARRPRT